MSAHYQSEIADSPTASDDFDRGNLEGDVALPKRPIRDPVVMEYEELSEPRLSPAHDVVGRALASFFTRGGGWTYLTQDMVAREARLSRQTTCKALRDLERVGRFEKRDMHTLEGNRGDAYRLHGDRNGWTPVDLGMPERTTADTFLKDMEIQHLRGLVHQMAALVPEGVVIPDSAITVVESFHEGSAHRDYWASVQSSSRASSSTLSSKLLDSALDAASEERRDWVTESQLIDLAIHQERAGLTEAAILEAWDAINPGTSSPECLDVGHLTKSRAFRVVRWLRRQPDAPVAADSVDRILDDDLVCICDAPVSAWAEGLWASVLTEMEDRVPRPTFETWLRGTSGMCSTEGFFMVRVPTPLHVSWLDRRLYHSLQQAVEDVAGQSLALLFQAQDGCAVHDGIADYGEG